jgi:hypothetical protein
MEFYLVLVLATLLIGGLSAVVWLKTRQIAFLVGFAFLYYWSLYGGWLVVNRAQGNARAYRFEYLFYRLFPVYLDQDYLWSLILYTAFIVTTQLTVLAIARSSVRPSDALGRRICVSHEALTLIAAVLTVGAYSIVWDVAFGSSPSGETGYGALSSRAASMPLFTLYQILHEAAVTLSLIGLVIYLSGSDARYAVGRPGSRPVGYLLVIPAIVALNVLLGNRSMLVFASLGAGLLYLVNARRPNLLLVGAAGALAVTSLVLLGVIRGTAGQRELGNEDAIGKIRYTITEAMSQDVEAFAAHASMYGTLQKHVPLTYGASLAWLASSVIPGIVRPEIAATSYSHYAAHVGAAQGQGFTIHHATGWYINFGAPGVLLGAFALGWFWAGLFNLFLAVDQSQSHAGRVFATLAFWTFTAYLPMLIRSGPEAYKGAMLESLLIPAGLLVASSIRVVRLANRPQLVPIPSAADLAHPIGRGGGAARTT